MASAPPKTCHGERLYVRVGVYMISCKRISLVNQTKRLQRLSVSLFQPIPFIVDIFCNRYCLEGGMFPSGQEVLMYLTDFLLLVCVLLKVGMCVSDCAGFQVLSLFLGVYTYFLDNIYVQEFMSGSCASLGLYTICRYVYNNSLCTM